MRPAIHHLSINAVRADALFASPLQRSDEPAAEQVREAIASAIREFGPGGCSERVAQEFGDHPETAVLRMRWARWVAGEAFTEPGPAAHARLFARHFAAHMVHAVRAVHVIRAA
jgi:hypothetical protein